jgi:hypothetical protein
MPNAGLASGLALAMGNIATIGLAPAIYGPLMNVTGSTLASWWRSKPTDKGESIKEKGESIKEKGERRKEKGERRKEKGERQKRVLL